MQMWIQGNTCDEGTELVNVCPGLRDVPPTDGRVVTQITGRREERGTRHREQPGMTGKHLIAGTFTTC